ncbi:MAG: HAMP domain-containing protein [Thermoleophilaceae bacterium]|nr:HAMP domain-containing protein [Thermoleophilaceae bacterium]
MRRVPIRLKLTLAFAVVMAAVLGGMGLLLYDRLEASIDETIDEGLATRLADVSALVREGGPAYLSYGRELLVERDERLAQVLGPNGRVLSASTAIDRPVVPAAVVREARTREVRVERARLPGVDTPVRLLAGPARADGRPVVVAVGSALDDRDEELGRAATLLWIGGPVALLLASGAGYLLATAALRPVEAMRRRAAEISEREPGRRLPVPEADDEVGRLGETLNEMLDRLEAALARERTFVADASHELRTPLAILKTELELAQRSARTAEELETALRSAAEETDRLAMLAEDLLVLARSDQGRLPIRRADVDVGELLERVRRRFAPAGMDLRISVEPGLGAELDELRIEQALGNLVDNARRHGAGPIELSARRGAGGVELSVRDHGHGFPPELLDHVFERFARGDAGRSTEGAGLGLAIVEAIAVAHDGSVTAANVNGGGAEVTISA